MLLPRLPIDPYPPEVCPMMGCGWGGVLSAIVLFWFVVVVALLVLLAIFGRRWRRPAGGPHGPATAAGWPQSDSGVEGILAERFARGDIDEAEYRSRLEVLRSSSPGSPPSA